MTVRATMKKDEISNNENDEEGINEYWTSCDKETYKMRWQDYRTNYINRTELANKIMIKRANLEELQREDYEGSQASIQSATLTNIETNQGVNIIMGGELVRLEVVITTYERIANPIVGFLLKNDKGVTLLGENSFNKLEKEKISNINKDKKLRIRFDFTVPMLPQGDYSISTSIVDGNQEEHKILHWRNDAIILHSSCSSVAAGLAGVPMHSIRMESI
jgi:lipopolysaccharide transport system ATP-binding protein